MLPFKLPTSAKAIADLTTRPTVHKSRKPRFELHLKIYDLNNVPLVSGVSSVKWHLPHSIRSEHRGRTHKRPIANHRVEYNYAKVVPVRLVVDRNNRLSDCPIEFEISQEFESHGTSRDEKIILGKITLNLAEYVAESEVILRDMRPGMTDSRRESLEINPHDSVSSGWHSRKRSSISAKGTVASLGTIIGTIDSASLAPSSAGNGPASTAGSSTGSLSISGASGVDDGVIRRYLMQDSKINSTLKIGILMVQIEGERNFTAPALKSAPVFGGITGIIAGGDVLNAGESVALEDHDEGSLGAIVGSKGHEMTETQDVYRRALAASWACQDGELPADECIEDIFGGGDGFRESRPDDPAALSSSPGRHFTGGKSRLTMPAGTSLGSVSERPRWHVPSTSHSSPTRSPIHEEDENFTPEPVTREPSAKKHVHCLLPTLGSIRRQGPQAHRSTEQATPLKTKLKDTDSGANASSSGDDGHSAGNGSDNTCSSNNDQEDEEGEPAFGHGYATLRPSDIRKLRIQGSRAPFPTSSSSSVLAAMRLHDREDSGLSDQTVTARPDLDLPLGFRSNRSSPGPQRTSFGHLRKNENAELMMVASGSSSQTSTHDRNPGRGDAHRSSERLVGGSRQNSGQGSGREEDVRRQPEVSEYEVRDDFVAWQLPNSVSTPS